MATPEYVESNRFFDYFSARADFIRRHCLDMDTVEGLILTCCYIEALGGFRWPDEKRNQVRFRRLILEHSGQDSIWRKVSLTALRAHLETEHEKLPDNYDKLFRKLQVTPQAFVNLNHNPDIDCETIEKEAENILVTPFSDPLKEKIGQFDYLSILWKRHRNLAVHEARKSQKSAPSTVKETQPFYRRVSFIENGSIGPASIWFDIPTRFVLETLVACIDSFEKYANQNKIDVAAGRRPRSKIEF